MRQGRRLIGSKSETVAPDGGAAPKWLLSAVICMSSVALLATSEEPDAVTPTYGPQYATTYTFERKGIDGGEVDLTVDRPRATFYANLRADALGPEGVVTTGTAAAEVHATVSMSGFSPGTPPPFALFRVRERGNSTANELQVVDQYLQTVPLTFAGNCSEPTTGTACTAQFALEVSRTDDGQNGGTLHVDWHFDVTASATTPSTIENSQVGPADPPWTIGVER